MTIDQTMCRLEEAMHSLLDQPVTGDFMSLTRAWREILEDFRTDEVAEINRLAAMIGRYQELAVLMARIGSGSPNPS
jgi:hypothetical protein